MGGAVEDVGGAGEFAGFYDRFFEGEDDVAELGGAFEVASFGGGEHLFAEAFDPFAGFAFEEKAGVFDAFSVFGGSDDVGEAEEFGADVVVEAVGAVGEFGGGGVGEEDAELAAEFGKGAAERSGVGEGAEVAGAVLFADAGEAEAGHFGLEIDAEEEEAFIVGEVGVVAGFPLFDELAFEEEGFGFAFDFEDVEIGDDIDEGADFRLEGEAAGGLEIGGDAFFEGFGFADVDDSSEAVFHQVHAGGVRELPDLFLDFAGVACSHSGRK